MCLGHPERGGPENGQINFHVTKRRRVLFINGNSNNAAQKRDLGKTEKYSLRIWSQYVLLWPKMPTHCQALSKQLLEKEHTALISCKFKSHLHQEESIHYRLRGARKV